MDSFYKFSKEFIKTICVYACCSCNGKQYESQNDGLSSNENSSSSSPTHKEYLNNNNNNSKTNNDMVMKPNLPMENLLFRSNKKENILNRVIEEKLFEENLKISNEMNALKDIKTKVGNGVKGLTDSLTSRTRDLKNRKSSGGESPLKKITDKLHIKSRKNGSKTPSPEGSKFERIKKYSHKLSEKTRCNKRSNHGIDQDSRPSFGKRRTTNETGSLSQMRGSYIDQIESESARY
ncbi:unnamed protein product [Brachionus calyciflorus]|uniref:Uncharacterized protein n=1 Tax=Brachionus calyciflorus TaxID=104777 RepID=A0A813MFH1_9BILA|nr:unnamed protein product [Brachionus calyciflorus]